MYEFNIAGKIEYAAASSRKAAVAKISRSYPLQSFTVRCCGRVG